MTRVGYKGEAFRFACCGYFALLLAVAAQTSSGLDLPKWLREDPRRSTSQWTNCTLDEDQPRELSIGIAMTSKLFARFGERAKAREWIQSLVDGANFIYMRQLNIRMIVKDVHIQSLPQNSQSWDDPTCSLDLSAKLAKFAAWTPPSRQGLWELFDDCLPGADGRAFTAKTGQAYQGTLCQMEPQVGKFSNVGVTEYLTVPLIGDVTWRVFAHEAGHTFGAGHPFGEGIVLVDGGIMSYGTGHYECELGFHPEDQDDICPTLNAAERDCAAISTLQMSRDQFMSALPGKPPSLDLDVVKCGWNGFSLTQLAIISATLLCLCCCCLCCLCFCVSRICSRTCGRSYDAEDP